MNKFLKLIRWFYPGLRIKRWIILLLAGLAFILISSVHIAENDHMFFRIANTVLFTVGIASLIAGIAYLIKSFFDANMDLLGERPRIDLSNQYWPIYASSLELPPAKINKSEVINSLVSEGVIINDAQIRNSILGRGVVVERGCLIEDSIVMDFTQIRSKTKIKKAIIDRFNIVESNTCIGYNLNEDERRHFVDRDTKIVVVKRGPRRLFHY